MKVQTITPSDSATIKAGTGFQPDEVYIGVGGTITIITDAADTIAITVYGGTWWPSDAWVKIKSTGTTATGLIAVQRD